MVLEYRAVHLAGRDEGDDDHLLARPLEPVDGVDGDVDALADLGDLRAERGDHPHVVGVDAGVDPDDVGVIAPFRAQVAEIGERVDVTVDTVDRFQGSSEEVIVVSFVATGEMDGPIFEDHRRVNVALARAKRALCLVGDANALRSEPFYEGMLDWARR